MLVQLENISKMPTAVKESSNLIRNILIVVLVLMVGVTTATSIMLWRRKQRA